MMLFQVEQFAYLIKLPNHKYSFWNQKKTSRNQTLGYGFWSLFVNYLAFLKDQFVHPFFLLSRNYEPRKSWEFILSGVILCSILIRHSESDLPRAQKKASLKGYGCATPQKQKGKWFEA